jgi:hypothetical protein
MARRSILAAVLAMVCTWPLSGCSGSKPTPAADAGSGAAPATSGTQPAVKTIQGRMARAKN